MKSVRRSCWFFCFLFSGLLPLLAQNATKVAKIEVQHVGPPAVSDSLIRANIRVKEGEPFLRPSVDEDIRNLYATGYFYNIRVGEEPTPDGVKLIYVFQGKPRLTEIKFSGNKKFAPKKLSRKLTSKVGKPLDQRKLFGDAQEIEKMYQKVGYPRTTVKPVVSIDENAGRGSVTFEIKETGKVKVIDVAFDGAQAFTKKKLRKVLKTKRRWFLSWLTGSGVLKEDEFEDDKDRLIEFYQNEGYIDFEIKEVKFDYKSPSKMIVRFVISEGSQYKVGAVTFTGNKLFSEEEISKGIVVAGRLDRPRMTVGKTFTPKGLKADTEAIADYYGSKGYISTEIKANKSANTTTGTMDLVYEIKESDKSYIERIDIKGNYKTKDRVIRRELAVSPGEVYDTVRVKLSKARLEGLTYFEKVDTQPEDNEGLPNRKNLVVAVDEKDTGYFTFGAGFSSVDNLVGFVEVTQGNFDLFKPPTFTGAGQKFRLKAQIGTQRQDYQVTFIEPWFLNRKLQLGVDLYHQELNFLSDIYDETRTGGTLSLTRALGSEFLLGKISYTLESIGIDIARGLHPDNQVRNVTVGTGTNATTRAVTNFANVSQELYDERGNRLVSKIGTSLAYDTRNHALLPSRGQRTELIGELAGGVLGGDTDFYKLELRSDWYFPGFFEGHIFQIGAETGVVEPYGDSSRVPLFDRWYLGGANTMRGYKFRHVGPRDRFGEPIGGNTYVFGTIEYSLPIIERLRFAVFYDIGNVYRGSWDYSHLRDFNDNWGVGLRINIPQLGPLRLDYGVPITHGAENSGSGRFQFGASYGRGF